MIERISEKKLFFKKRYTLTEDVNIYLEAFSKTRIGINMMFTDDHKVYNNLNFLLRYYSNRKECIKELKYIKKLLDENTTVQSTSEKTYYSASPRTFYRFTKFEFSKELKEEINKLYNELVSKAKTNPNGLEK